MTRSGWMIAIVAAVAACGGGATPPGSIAMGNYRIRGGRATRRRWSKRPARRTAQLATAPKPGTTTGETIPTDTLAVFPEASVANFEFPATLSKNEGTEAFLTLKDRNRDAFFDGQVLTSTLDRATTFSNCHCDSGARCTWWRRSGWWC